MVTISSRQQTAQRIHTLLLREMGHEIDIDRLLEEPRYARDVLLVCEAFPGSELAGLAAQLRASADDDAALQGTPGHARQATDWSRDTSGFGVSRPPPLPAAGDAQAAAATDAAEEDRPERRRNWLTRWQDS